MSNKNGQASQESITKSSNQHDTMDKAELPDILKQPWTWDALILPFDEDISKYENDPDWPLCIPALIFRNTGKFDNHFPLPPHVREWADNRDIREVMSAPGFDRAIPYKRRLDALYWEVLRVADEQRGVKWIEPLSKADSRPDTEDDNEDKSKRDEQGQEAETDRTPGSG